MMADRYQDELRWLHEAGRRFAASHPQAARYLGEAGADPDVERLLEGVAFLTARVHERLDAGRGDLTHGLLAALLPHLVQPWPALTLVQATLPRTARSPVAIPVGAGIESGPIDGLPCSFHSVWGAVVPAHQVVACSATAGRLHLRLAIRPGADASVPVQVLRLHPHGEPALALALRQALLQGNARVGGRPLRCTPVGLDAPPLVPGTAALPGAWRLLAEFLAFPEAFHAVDLHDLPPGAELDLTWDLPRVPRELDGLGPDHLLTGVFPVANVWAADAEPIAVDPALRALPVREAGQDPLRRRVLGITGVRSQRREWPQVLVAEGIPGPCWQELHHPDPVGDGSQVSIAWSALDEDSKGEVLSLRVLASDGMAASRVALGDLRHAGADMPPGLTLRNLAVPRRPLFPAVLPDLHARLVRHLALGRGPCTDAAALRHLLAIHDVRRGSDGEARRQHERTAAAIREVQAVPGTHLVDGVPARVLALTTTIDEDALGGAGAAHLLGTVLDACLGGLSALNTATRLSLRLAISNDLLRWPVRLGQQVQR